MTDRDVELRITAADDASKVIDGVADTLDALPDSAEVDIAADTRAAETNIERLARELEDATDDTRELRVTFRGEQLQREIRNSLRALERLEDPVEIEAATRDLERAQGELRDLAELADREYNIEVNADPKRTASRAAGDLDDMRAKADGLQSATPALRGFTDELGGTSAAAGIAGQAVADLGDFAGIMGEKFGIAEGATARVSTALGAAGLAAVIGGVALPVLLELIEGQSRLAEETDGAREALSEQTDVLKLFEDFVDNVGAGGGVIAAVLGDEDDAKVQRVLGRLGEIGLTVEDLPAVLEPAADAAAGFFTELLAGRGVPAAVAADMGRLIASGEALGPLLGTVDAETAELVGQLALLRGEASFLDFGSLFEEQVVRLAGAGEISTATIADIEAGTITAREAYETYLDTVDETGTTQRDAARQTDAALREVERAYGGVNDEIGGAILAAEQWGRDTAAAAGVVDSALTETVGVLDRYRARLDVREAMRQFVERTQDAIDKIGQGLELSEADVDAWRRNVLDAAADIGGIDETIVVDLLAQADDGLTLAEIERTTNVLQGYANRNPVTVRVVTRGQIGGSGGVFVDENGNVRPGIATLVGIATALSGAASGDTGRVLGSGGLTVNVNTSASMRDVDSAITRWRRLNG